MGPDLPVSFKILFLEQPWSDLNSIGEVKIKRERVERQGGQIWIQEGLVGKGTQGFHHFRKIFPIVYVREDAWLRTFSSRKTRGAPGFG